MSCSPPACCGPGAPHLPLAPGEGPRTPWAVATCGPEAGPPRGSNTGSFPPAHRPTRAPPAAAHGARAACPTAARRRRDRRRGARRSCRGRWHAVGGSCQGLWSLRGQEWRPGPSIATATLSPGHTRRCPPLQRWSTQGEARGAAPRHAAVGAALLSPRALHQHVAAPCCASGARSVVLRKAARHPSRCPAALQGP